MFTLRLPTVVMVGCTLCACGIQGPDQEREDDAALSERPEDATAAPIIGGAEAVDYPESVVVNMKKGGWQTSICSGSLIAPNVVLTAGHCVVGYDGWEVYAPYAGNGQWATAASASTYDWTDNGNSINPNQHDGGLLVLNSDILIDSYPIVASQPVPNGTKVVNIGRIDNGVASYSELFVSQPLSVSRGSAYGFPYAYWASKVIQPGDSGGPDMLLGPAPHTVVAVNSGAGSGFEILARVDLVYDWIQSVIAANDSSPPPQPPSDPVDCAHDICDEGSKLDASCDPCATSICATDPYCCNNSWDSQCVSEVDSICGLSCDPPEDPPPPPPPPADPCNGVTWEGECTGAVLSWCENQQVHTIDCGASGKQCGWDSNNNYYNCI